MSNNYQKYFTFTPEYIYNYLVILNQFNENYVPDDYLYDNESDKFMQSNTTLYKFYYNNSRNGDKYCFKVSFNCPEEYHYFNETTKECLNYTKPVHTIIPTTIPTTILTTIPTTIPTTI